MLFKKTLLFLTALLCIGLQAFSTVLTCPDAIDSIILQSNWLSESLIFQTVNENHRCCRLVPSAEPDATVEQRVLYAARYNDESVLSDSQETRLYELVRNFIESAKDDSDVVKVYAAATTVCYMCRYDLDAERNTAYALVSRKGSCSNYSRIMQLILESVNVDCYYVVGAAGDDKGIKNHAWNIVKIDDCYFHCDSTWCDNEYWIDQYSRRVRPRLKYLLMDDDEAAKTRTWNKRLYPKACTDTTEYIRHIYALFYESA